MILDTIRYGAIAFLLSFAGVFLFQRLARRRNLIAVPNERSSHDVPTPTGGGVVIVIVTLALSLIYGFSTSQAGPLIPLTIGGLVIAIVSWIDDVRPLPAVLRFAVHALAAGSAIFAFGYFQVVHLPLFHEIDLGWIGLPLTVLWIVGLTNAFNFMDGIDGIAGTQALIAGAGWALIGVLAGQPLLIIIGALLAAASLGFLLQNWQPARIFMGDVGSAFLGYIFAVLPLLFLYLAPEQTKSISCGALFCWVFIFDTTFTFIKRALRRENVLAAHRGHLYQRLVIAGFSHQRVTIIYGLLAIIGVVLSIAWFQVWDNYRLYFYILPLMCIGLWLFVAKKEKAKNAKVVMTEN